MEALKRPATLLGVLVALGVALRVAISFAWQPAVMNTSDEVRYVVMAMSKPYADPLAPGGYAMFMQGLHAISANVSVTVAAQHLIGIGTALLMFATVRRLGTPIWVATVGAAALLVSLDQVFLEHAVLAESLFTALLVAFLYASVRALDSPRSLGRSPLDSAELWILAAGGLLGLSVWVRGVSLILIPAFAIWLALALPGAAPRRLKGAAIGGVAATLLVLVYFTMNWSSTGNFSLTQPNASGWGFYSRVAPFADCNAFDPPRSTIHLCESTAPDNRPGGDFYGWRPASPARQRYGKPPTGGEELQSFARAAALGQPFDYVSAVLGDFARYFIPGVNDARRLSGTGYLHMDIAYVPSQVGQIQMDLGAYYSNRNLKVTDPVHTLSDLQSVLRAHPLLLFAALILGVAALPLMQGRVRSALALFLLTAVLLLLFPAAIAGYSARYSAPIAPPLLAAGAMGLWCMARWIRAR